MKYALLAYGASRAQSPGPIEPELAELLAEPDVTGWIRLHNADSATTLSSGDGGTLVTDGPFIDSKEILGGLIMIEAANLDEALAFAARIQGTRAGCGALEVRPVLEEA